MRWNMPPGKTDLIGNVKLKILQLESSVPPSFMHRLWGNQRKKWTIGVNECRDHYQLGRSISALQRNIRPIVFSDSWTSGIGLMRMHYYDNNNHSGLSIKGGGGWYWLGSSKRHRYRPCSEIGLHVLSRKIEEIVRRPHYSQDENKVDSMVLVEMERANNNFDLYIPFGISTGVQDHTLYPHWSTSFCQLDDLLARRIEALKYQRLAMVRHSQTDYVDSLTHSDSTFQRNLDSFRTFVGLHNSSMARNVKIEKDAPSPVVDESDISNYWYPDTSDPFLLKLGRKNSTIFVGHQPFFDNKRSIFTLATSEQRRLTRGGGLRRVPLEFLYEDSEDDCVFYPSSFVKPTFERVWTYRTLCPSSLSQIVLQLRKLNSCLRLHEMTPPNNCPLENKTESIEILDHKDIDDMNRIFFITINRPGEMQSGQPCETSHSEWVSDSIPLWQIKQYCESYELRKATVVPPMPITLKTSDVMGTVRWGNKPVSVTSLPKSKMTPQNPATELSTDPKELQKIKVYKGQDGSTFVKGLKLGQRLMQMGDGAFRLLSANPDNCAPAYSGASSRKVEKISFPESHDPSDSKSDFEGGTRMVEPKPQITKSIDHQIVYIIRCFLHDTSDVSAAKKLHQLFSIFPQKVTKYLGQHGLDPSLLFAGDNPPTGDNNLLNVCSSVMSSIIDRVERHDKISRKRMQGRAVDNRQRKPFNQKLMTQLEKQKHMLKKEIMRKRSSTEQSIRREVQNEVRRILEKSKVQEVGHFVQHNSPTPGSPTFCPEETHTSPLKEIETPSPRDSSLTRFVRASIPMDDKKLYCICQTPYDNNRFYIGCDVCKNWFHGSCVNLYEEEADKLESYICDTCRQVVSTHSSFVRPPEESTKLCALCYTKCHDYVSCKICHVNVHKTCLPEKLRDQSPYVCVSCAGPDSEVTPDEEMRVYCICQTGYDDTRFYIGCDGCRNWFHGSCVGLTENEAERIESYICVECAAKQQSLSVPPGKHSTKKSKKRRKTGKISPNPAKVADEDVSCICRRPYDSREYIGCDTCDDWLHFDCIGISRLDANRLKHYICPRCRAQNEDESKGSPHQAVLTVAQNQNILTQFIADIKKHKMAWPFVESFNWSKYPDYYDIISEPIDLDVIEKNAMMGRYKYIDSFMADLMRIFTNCRMYHQQNNTIFRCGNVMETMVVTRIKNVIKKLHNPL